MSSASEAKDGTDAMGVRAHVATTLDALFANSSEAIVVVDEEGSIRYVTPGAVLLLGYDADTVVGSSVFSYLHPDDTDAAADLFIQRLDYDGADLGHEIRVRSATGRWLVTLVTASLLPDPDLGVVAITIRSLDEVDTVERSLRTRVVVEEYCNRLGAAFMDAYHADDMHKCLRASLAEIGLLTGADVVAVFLERQERGILERLGGWTAAGDGDAEDAEYIALDSAPFREAGELILGECTHHDDLSAAPAGPVVDIVRALGIFSLLTAPFSTGSQRGVVVLVRTAPGPAWSDADAQLTRNVAGLYGRALQTAEAEELLALTYRRGPVAISIRTWDGALVDCNDQYLKLFAVTRREATRLALSDLLHPDDRAWVTERIGELHQGLCHELVHEVRVLRPDGQMMRLRTKAVTLQAPGSSEPYVLCVLEDVTEAHGQRVELEYAASHDSLTGVANRAAMIRAVEDLVRRGEAPALLVIDLDRFKLINDSMGHVAGDDVLRAVAERLCREVRHGDLVARLGGDEFAVVVPGIGAGDARELADRMRRAMETAIDVGGRPCAQTVSIGVAMAEDGLTGDELLVRADRALYAAKAKGRNLSIMFDGSMRDEVLSRLNTERELRHAIDHAELEVHFQPEFDLRDRTILGVEALLRWNHPREGVIPADRFIDVAEECGIIDELGRFALREACRAFARVCIDIDRDDLMLRVNISAREFVRPELPDLVRDALRKAYLEPSQLCLEMTEMTLMDSPEVALKTFDRLHEIGVQFAIDDFGTGYSSLTYLKRFPVDAVKIDRGFVADLESDADSRAIIGSIVNLASALSLDVVAEGVETEQQLNLLSELGCERGQGFLVSGALSEIDLASFLRG